MPTERPVNRPVSRRREHITRLHSRQCHWLPLRQRIELNLAVLKCKRSMACLRSTWPVHPNHWKIVQRCYVWGYTNSHKSGLSIVQGWWTASLEQPTSPVSTYVRDSELLVEFHWLLRTAAPCRLQWLFPLPVHRVLWAYLLRPTT